MVLDQIVGAVRRDLELQMQTTPLQELEGLASEYGPTLDFEAALRTEGISIIAEVKRASPSRGLISPDLDVARLVESYRRGGAAAISVLTEPTGFRGSLEDLATARHASALPLLCKDFFLDRYQMLEARLCGADAVLLIVAVLGPRQLGQLMKAAGDLGLATLVEVHTEAEVDTALDAGARVIGINNRNLQDFTVDVTTTVRLRPSIPSNIVVVSESGISSYADVFAMQLAGVDAVLVGEALASAANPETKLRELKGGR